MDIQLIAVDLDGTALDSKKILTPRTLAAVQNALEAGKYVIPATGRSLNSIPAQLMKLNSLSHLILNNGAAVVSLPQQEMIFSRVFEQQTALSLLKRFKTFPCIITASTPQRGTIDTGIHGMKDEKLTDRFMQIMEIWNPAETDIEKSVKENPPWVNFFTFVFTDNDQWRNAYELYKKQEGLSVASSAWGCIDIMPPGIHKGSALSLIAEKLGIEKSRIMAIGDNHNDMEMLQNSGYKVAMGNAVDELKKIADRVTLSCDEDGAAIAIEEIL